MYGTTSDVVITIEHESKRHCLSTVTSGFRNRLQLATSPANNNSTNILVTILIGSISRMLL